MSSENKWVVKYHRNLEREIRRLPKRTIKRILETIEALAIQPKPPGSRKIRGHELWRVQVGNYRILYYIDEEKQVISTYRVGHRRDVYRRL